MLKRTFDVVIATLAVILLAPLLAVGTLLVRLDSPGPVLFSQVRVGRYGREFRIHKFRTMRAGSDTDGPQVTVKGDRRITRIGGRLRKHKLDELPQLINIIMGDMSVVGPRPEIPHYVSLYPREVRENILSVRPGMTDWASVCFRSESEVLAAAADPEASYRTQVLPLKLGYSVEYANRHTLIDDFRIMAATLMVVLKPDWQAWRSWAPRNIEPVPLTASTDGVAITPPMHVGTTSDGLAVSGSPVSAFEVGAKGVIRSPRAADQS